MRTAGSCLLVLVTVSASALSAQVARRPFLFKDARGELAAARARGEADVLLVIASMPGANARVAGTVTAFGGTIQFRADDVDYLRARVPVDSVELLVRHPDVHSVDVSITRRSRAFGLADTPAGPAPVSGPGGRPFAQDTTKKKDEPWPPVLSEYPLTNRYSPLADIGAESFRETNPTYDGRGVTLALIDGNPDMLLPELQVATALDGRPIPKIVVYETVIDGDEEPDGRWIAMDSTVTTDGDRFEHDSVTYTAPRAGTFRIGVFDEAVKDSLARTRMDKDYNRDGNPEGSSRLFGVLWDEATGDVWVDTDQDHDFADETALTDYRTRPGFGVLGTDDPETPIRESVGFAVQIDRAKTKVALNWGVASHASLVIGAALASRGTEGRFEGVAPGARLASVSEGGSAYGQTEAAIVAARHPDVDIIFFEQSSLITRNYLLRDGRLVATVIYERLIDVYRKPIVVPTHNYPILGGIDDFVLARGAIGIGGHESKDNFFANHGVRVTHDDNLLITGGYGPMGNGALKPDVISPSNYVSTARGFEEGRAIPGLFQLPPGYTIAGGTSTATPTAAAAIALLISAAKQEGIAYDAFSIKDAIARSARYVPHLPAYKQGNGVVDVAAAWEILQNLATTTTDVSITAQAPVRTEYSHLLPTPHVGVGLYERDGWSAGDRGERTVTFTRTTGPRNPMTFTVRWVGNDSMTYSSPATLRLPLGSPVPLTVGIAPSTPGAHTALLTLEHPDVPGYAHRMLTTIVAADPLHAANDYTIETKVEVPRPGMASFFFRVPPSATALRVEVEASKRPVSLAVIRPDTRAQTGTRELPRETGKSTFVVVEPPAGVWEIRLTDVDDTRTFDWEQAKKDEPVPPTPATLTVSALSTGVTVSDALVTVPTGASANTSEITLTNTMAAFTGAASSTPMGSARRERATIREHAQLLYEVDVPPGSAALVARVAGVTDPEADLDLYVFDCTDEEDGCQGARTDGDPRDNESVIVLDPAAGRWKIAVDAPQVPTGRTAFDYLDVVFNPSYGTVALTDTPGERARDASWTATAHAWTAIPHPDGRVPYAGVVVHGHPKDEAPYLVTLQQPAQERATETGSNMNR